MTKPLVAERPDLIVSYWTGETKKKEKNNPVKAFKEYCENEPWALECREYEV